MKHAEKISDNTIDNEILDVDLESYNELIWSIVHKFTFRGYDKNDLFQSGFIGLMKAYKKFDVNYGAKLSTFAVPYIIGEIKHYLRSQKDIKLNSYILKRQKEIKKAICDLTTRNNISPSLLEVAKHLNIELNDVIVAYESMNSTLSMDSLSNGSDDNKETVGIELFVSTENKDTNINKVMFSEMLDSLNNIEKNILLLRYYHGYKQHEVAKTFEINQVKVSRIEKRAISKMRKLYEEKE